MGIEQQGSHESQEQQKLQESALDSLTSWAKDKLAYAQAVAYGETDEIANHHIEHSEEFDDREAMDVMATGDLSKVAEYLEGPREGQLSDNTMLQLNDMVLARTSPYSNISPEDSAAAARVFRVLNRNTQVAEKNADDFLQLLKDSATRAENGSIIQITQVNLERAAVRLTGLESTRGIVDENGEDRYVMDEIYSEAPDLIASTFPEIKEPYGTEEHREKAINELLTGITGKGLVLIEQSGDLDKVIRLLESDYVSGEERQKLGEAIAKIHFGKKAQNKENSIESAGPATKLMLAVTQNRMPYTQFVEIVENFYGPHVTHGYMHPDIREKIEERMGNLQRRDKQEASASLSKTLTEFGRDKNS